MRDMQCKIYFICHWVKVFFFEDFGGCNDVVGSLAVCMFCVWVRMRMNVCDYVLCVSASAYVYTCVCNVGTFVCTRMSKLVHVYVSACVCVHMCVYMSVHVSSICGVRIFQSLSKCARMYPAYVHMDIYALIHLHMHTYTDKHKHKNIYIHTYIPNLHRGQHTRIQHTIQQLLFTHLTRVFSLSLSFSSFPSLSLSPSVSPSLFLSHQLR